MRLSTRLQAGCASRAGTAVSMLGLHVAFCAPPDQTPFTRAGAALLSRRWLMVHRPVQQRCQRACPDATRLLQHAWIDRGKPA
jgi:hypothetical protein